MEHAQPQESQGCRAQQSTKDGMADECYRPMPADESVSDLEPICEAEQTSFCVELMKRLNVQRRQNYLCDITLVAKEGKEFKAHRNVLSAASPFFAKLLQSDMKEKEEGVIRFEEISESILGDVLEFIYTGTVKIINERNAKDLIIAADYLLLVCLKIKSGRFLQKQMSICNCISTFYFAEKYQCQELVAKSRKFTHDNFASVAELDEFLNLESEEVERWISSDEICVAAEEDVFEIVKRWIEQNKSERKAKFEKLFRHVRLVFVSRDCLFADVVTDEMVREHFSCLRQVSDAMKLVSSASEDTLQQSPRRRLETHAIVAYGGTSTFCYIPEKDRWKRLANGVSEPRNENTHMLKFHDQLYTFPGNSKAERYDPVFNSWTTLGLSLPFRTHLLAVVRGQIYAICESDEHRKGLGSSTIKRYDVKLCAWQTVLSSQEGYYSTGSCVVASGNCLYVLGGISGTQAGRFDIVKNKWEKIASMQIERSFAFGVAFQGKIFIAGGKGSRTVPADHRADWFLHVRNISTPRYYFHQSCEVYNVSTNEWQSIRDLNTPRSGGSMVCLNGTLYVLGGSDNSTKAKLTVESYDPTVNKWIVKTSIPVANSAEEQKHSFKACALKLSKGVLGTLTNSAIDSVQYETTAKACVSSYSV